MTDYYPLIAKAVAGLDKATGENRRALYERARTALVTQLRSVQPPLSESEITRERLSLEEGIRKVEAEAARRLQAETQQNARTEAPRSNATEPAASASDLAEMASRLEKALRRGKGEATGANRSQTVLHRREAAPAPGSGELFSSLEAEMAHLLGRDTASDRTRTGARPEPRETPRGPTAAARPAQAAADLAGAGEAGEGSQIHDRTPFLARLPEVVVFILCLIVAVPIAIVSGGVGMFETALAIQVADAVLELGAVEKQQLIDLTIVPAGMCFGLIGLLMPIVGLLDDRRRHLAERETGRGAANVIEFPRPAATPPKKKAPPKKVTREQLDKLLAKGDLQTYLQHAQAFLADERRSLREQKHDILAVVATVYERLSPTSCGELIAAAHAPLRQAPELKSALNVCRCPERFESRSIAEHWLEQFDPDDLTFCPAMQAASFVIRARVMEICGDFGAMERAADEALRLTPQWPGAQHWKVRAALRGSGELLPDLPRELDLRRGLPAGRIDPLYDIGLRHARWLLSLGRMTDAARVIEILLHTVDELPDGVASAWTPRLRYWRAMALARADRPRAAALLETLVGGPNSSEACTQLALLDLAQGDLVAAEQRMQQVAPTFPAAIYVHGLIHARRGDAAAANAMLDQMARFDGKSDGTERSPYPIAARRLRAAMAERAGHLREAEQLHVAILGQANDALTRARLARHKLRQAYDAWRQEGTAAKGLDGACDPGDAPFASLQRYRELHRILTGSTEEVEQVLGTGAAAQATQAERAVWLDIAVARLIQVNRPEQAFSLLIRWAQEPQPRSQARLALMLGSWRLLTRMAHVATAIPDKSRTTSEKSARDEFAALAVDAKSLLDAIAEWNAAQQHDVPLERWRFLLAQAVELARPGAILAPDAWKTLAPWPIAWLPALWSPDEDERAASAAQIAAHIDGSAMQWSEQQRLLLIALMAAARKDDDVFLEALGGLLPALAELPVDGIGLWLDAASLWLRRKDWARLLEDELPALVADLSDARVRLLIGLAYARAAAADAKGDPRRAPQRVRQARDMLEPLLADEVAPADDRPAAAKQEPVPKDSRV